VGRCRLDRLHGAAVAGGQRTQRLPDLAWDIGLRLRHRTIERTRLLCLAAVADKQRAPCREEIVAHRGIRPDRWRRQVRRDGGGGVLRGDVAGLVGPEWGWEGTWEKTHHALIKGKKRHILVDKLGLLLQALVTAADVRDRDGGVLLLSTLFGQFPFCGSCSQTAPIPARSSTVASQWPCRTSRSKS